MKHAMCAITIKRNKDKEMLQDIYDDLRLALGNYEENENEENFYVDICTLEEKLADYLN